MGLLGVSSNILNVNTYLVTPYFKCMDKMKITVKTRAFYLDPVQTGDH